MSLIVAVGPLPPPIHGAAAVNAAVCEKLAERYDLRVVDTSAAGASGPAYHVRRLRRHLRAGVTIWRHRHAPGPRWVYVTSPGGAAVWYLIPLLAIARACGFQIAVHHHSYAYLSRLTPSMKRLVSVIGAGGFHILLAPEMREQFDQMYRPKQPSLVCSNAAWMDREMAERGTPRFGDTSLRIGYLGSLSREKGLGELGNVVQRLLADGTETELWLAGAPTRAADQRLLEQTLGELGLTRGRWLGVIDGEHKMEFFNQIDVFVFPTRYWHEAQPLVVFEALAAGVPVAAYARGCIPSQLRHSGLLVPITADFVEYARSYLSGLGTDRVAGDEARRLARLAFDEIRSESTQERESLLRLLGTRCVRHEPAPDSFDSEFARGSKPYRLSRGPGAKRTSRFSVRDE